MDKAYLYEIILERYRAGRDKFRNDQAVILTFLKFKFDSFHLRIHRISGMPNRISGRIPDFKNGRISGASLVSIELDAYVFDNQIYFILELFSSISSPPLSTKFALALTVSCSTPNSW